MDLEKLLEGVNEEKVMWMVGEGIREKGLVKVMRG